MKAKTLVAILTVQVEKILDHIDPTPAKHTKMVPPAESKTKATRRNRQSALTLQPQQ